jgi:hypothetical protein
MTKTIGLITAVLLATACSKSEPPAEQNAGASLEAPAPAGASASNSAAATSASPEAPAPAALTLVGDGLAPGLKFGMSTADAVAAATRAFGKPTDKSHNGECGEGPMDFVGFHDFQLGFQEGKLAGWTLNGKTPALKTAGGIAIGTPRSALGKIAIDEESTLGPEFSVDDVGGVLGEGDKVVALWAGLPCQFR